MEKIINKNKAVNMANINEQAIESAIKGAFSLRVEQDDFTPSSDFSDKIMSSISTVSPYSNSIKTIHSNARVSPYNSFIKHFWKMTLPVSAVIAMVVVIGGSSYYEYYSPSISDRNGVIKTIDGDSTDSAYAGLLSQEELDAELMAYNNPEEDVALATYDSNSLTSYDITI